MSILRTELKERPIRLAVFLCLLLVVGSMVPYAERHDPDLAVHQTGNISKNMSIDDIQCSPHNRSTDDSGNITVENCFIAGRVNLSDRRQSRARPFVRSSGMSG